MYNEFYGFLEKPFEVTPDPKFLFWTPSHQEALNTMLEGIRNRWGFISITGEVGTGKTTLVHALLGKLDERVRTVFIFHTITTFPELLRDILQDLDQVPSRKNTEALLNQLKSYLAEKIPEDETLSVIIDEAQNLSGEVMKELGKLSDLDPQIMVRLQIIFVGQLELDAKLKTPSLRQLNQRISVRFETKALSREDTEYYIRHRLAVAGASSRLRLSTGAALAPATRLPARTWSAPASAISR